MSTDALRLAVLHEVVNRSGPVGKTQLQKFGYFLQEAWDIPTNYRFRMYHYGPYADSLETDMVRLKLTGYISVAADSQGYGFRITSIDDPMAGWSELIEPHSKAINDLIETFDGWQASRLELAATIHFVRKLLPTLATDEVVAKVKSLKPKFHDRFIYNLHADLERQGLLG